MLPAPSQTFNGALASPVILGERAEGIVKLCDRDGSSYFELFSTTNLAEAISQQFLGRCFARQFCVFPNADALSLIGIESVTRCLTNALVVIYVQLRRF
jgi:hypothetical protein